MCDVYHHQRLRTMRAGSVHVRHAIVEVPCVNVVIGFVLGELHVVVRVVPVLLVMLLWFIAFVLIAVYRSHCFHVAVSVAIFSVFGGIVFTLPSLDGKLLHWIQRFFFFFSFFSSILCHLRVWRRFLNRDWLVYQVATYSFFCSVILVFSLYFSVCSFVFETDCPLLASLRVLHANGFLGCHLWASQEQHLFSISHERQQSP